MIAGEDFVRHAEALLRTQNAGEIEWRMAAARAYYGVFHEVCAPLNIDFKLSAGGMHGVVKQELFSVPIDQTGPVLKLAKRHWDTL